MSSISSRREPYPWHMKLGVGSTGHGLMLIPAQDGLLVGKKTQSLENVTPTDQAYSSAPVYRERTFPFRPTRGMGERVQSSHTSRRYRYGLNVWVVGGFFGKGPLTHTLTPSTTGSIRDFVEALHSGAVVQFILAGENVLRRSGDTNGTQNVSETRAGNTATSGIRFKGSYASPVDALYVAWSDGTLRQYDGATWASATLPAGFLPQFLEKVGDELWAGDPTNNVVRKVTGDPLLAASWSGPITVGDGSGAITALRQVENRLFIFKDDGGVFTLNGDGSDNDLFPGLRVSRDSTNARTVQAGLDSLWFRMGQSFYRLQAGGGATLLPVGPERLRENDSEVRGPVQAFAFWGAIVGFAAVYSGSGSYLLSYGDWQTPPEGDADSQFVDQYDGALVKWSGKLVTCMRISDIATPDTRLYVGFSDGTYDYIKLVLNPLAASSGAEFTLGSSQLFVPLHHAMFQADWKGYRGFSAFGPVLSATDYAQISYRTDGAASYTASAANFTATAQRVDVATPLAGKFIDVRIDLVNTTTADTPVLEGIGIHEQVRPRLQLDWAGTIDARNGVAKLDGSTDRQPAEDIRDLMRQAADAPNAVSVTLPDESVQGFSFFGYSERLLNQKDRVGLGWAIDWQATQHKTETVYGTVGRLRGVLVGDLRGVLVGQLRTW